MREIIKYFIWACLTSALALAVVLVLLKLIEEVIKSFQAIL